MIGVMYHRTLTEYGIFFVVQYTAISLQSKRANHLHYHHHLAPVVRAGMDFARVLAVVLEQVLAVAVSIHCKPESH